MEHLFYSILNWLQKMTAEFPGYFDWSYICFILCILQYSQYYICFQPYIFLNANDQTYFWVTAFNYVLHSTLEDKQSFTLKY